MLDKRGENVLKQGILQNLNVIQPTCVVLHKVYLAIYVDFFKTPFSTFKLISAQILI